MLDSKIKKIRKLGFDVTEAGSNEERFVSLQTVPEKDVILKLIKLLTFEDEIFFWDYYHDTISDPGGYVTAYVLDKKRAVYMEGNHGWSSDFAPIPIDELADLIIKNWDKDCDAGKFFNKIRIKPHIDFKRDMYLYDIM